MASGPGERLTPWEYYQEYHGHSVEHLQRVLAAIRGPDGGRPVVFLAGDSSLDNKHWLFERANKCCPESYEDTPWTAEAVGGYRDVLDPPRMVQDVAYWLNALGSVGEGGGGFAALNTAVEESTLAGRAAALRAQDEFIRDHISSNDVLVISAGGNDVALMPSARTQVAMAQLMQGHKEAAMEHFVELFRDEVQAYATTLTRRSRPRLVIVCMVYFLLESVEQEGFADLTLKKLGYDADPGFLQGVIREVFETSTHKVSVKGTTVVPLPLYEALDSKDPSHYLCRVEPSVLGGERIALAIAKHAGAALGGPAQGET